MILIRPSYEIINISGSDLLNTIYLSIEEAARTCYKSQGLGASNPQDFVTKLIQNEHLSMLEHGTVYLTYKYPRKAWSNPLSLDNRYKQNPYSTVIYDFDEEEDKHVAYITTNYRVLVENTWLEDLKYLTKRQEEHIARYTVKFICSRACAQQLTRHRAFSFAMESQRYCNYSKDRFGNNITFILPEWYKGDQPPTPGDLSLRLFYLSCKESEGAYFDLLKEGKSPQEARVVLPNATKTEIVVTGTEEQWQHFFELRALNSTGVADAEIHRLASMLFDDLYK